MTAIKDRSVNATDSADWRVFPETSEDEIVEMPGMIDAARRTLAVHPLGLFVVWSGHSRVGKTTTAKWFRDQLNGRYDADPRNPNAFRTIHFEEGKLASTGGDEQRMAIKAVYERAVGRLDVGVYRRETAGSLARLTVEGLRSQRIRMVLIDEAGGWSPDALRGLVLLRNIAEYADWKTTFVLIGMEELTYRLERAEQIIGRVAEQICFEPYSLEETHELLRALHPHFASLDLKRRDDRAQVELIRKFNDGLAGKIVMYVQRFRRRYEEKEEGEPVDLAFLEITQMVTDEDIRRIREVARKSRHSRRMASKQETDDN